MARQAHHRLALALGKKMSVNNPSSQKQYQERIAKWCLLGIGSLLLLIAIFFDPIGSSPDSGVINLGTTGTKWLLGIFGSASILASAWGFLKKKR
jgi:hypothetical protein